MGWYVPFVCLALIGVISLLLAVGNVLNGHNFLAGYFFSMFVLVVAIFVICLIGG